MRNIKLILQYEGTRFVGWQRQRQENSVQQIVEEAIAAVTGEDVRIAGSGRTDAGVHALGQTAHVHLNSDMPCERLVAALNANLPPDIAIISAEDVAEDFHARFGARSKIYEYTIATGPVRPVLDRDFCWYVRSALDLAKMRRAAAHLVGEHDFAAFGAENFRRKTTVRTIHALDILPDQESPPRLRLRFHGNGFLYNMVRAITGTLVDVGRGKTQPEQVREILASLDRRAAGQTAPARGLCLLCVFYAGDSTDATDSSNASDSKDSKDAKDRKDSKDSSCPACTDTSEGDGR